MIRWLIASLIFVVSCGAPLHAQATAAHTPAFVVDEDAPVAVPVATDTVVRYQRGASAWSFVNDVWALVVPAIMLWTGFSGRLQQRLTRQGRGWFFGVAGYSAIYTALTFAAGWPLAYYLEFARPRLFGVPGRSIAGWLADSLSTGIATIVVAALSYWLLYLLIRKATKRWWLYSALLSLPVLWFTAVEIPPLFEAGGGQYERLQDPSIEADILALAERAHVHARVLVDTRHAQGRDLNAFAVGASRAQPIVFGRSLVDSVNRAELTALASHEIGHHAHHHVFWKMTLSWWLEAVALYAAFRIMPLVIARNADRFGFDRVSDIASLPLLFLVTGLAACCTHPIELAFARHQEREADRFALEQTHANHSFATGLIKAHQDEENPTDPHSDWFTQFWTSDHPSLAERIEFSNAYKPWMK